MTLNFFVLHKIYLWVFNLSFKSISFYKLCIYFCILYFLSLNLHNVYFFKDISINNSQSCIAHKQIADVYPKEDITSLLSDETSKLYIRLYS